LLHPLVVNNGNTYNVNIIGAVSQQQNRLYRPKCQTCYFTEPDRALIRKVYNIRNNTIDNDIKLSNIDLSLIAQNGMNMKFCRVWTISDRIKYKSEQLRYIDKLHYSDIHIEIGRLYRDSSIRLLPGNGIIDGVISRQIIIPDLGNIVRVPEYDYYIDTLSTPQSEMAGRIVSLCRGATIRTGRIRKGNSIFSEHLSEVISHPQNIRPERIPIIHATISQTVNIKANEEPLVRPKGYKGIVKGVNTYAALMDCGYTSNDGAIISESLADSMESYEITRQRVVLPINNYSILVKNGDTIIPNQPIVTYLNSIGKVKTTHSNISSRSTVKNVMVSKGLIDVQEVYILIVEYIERHKLVVGSKIAGIHSNKHIVAKILPDKEMPEGCFGRVNAIFSPSTVGKRENISYLFEGILGHLAKAVGNIDVIPFQGDNIINTMKYVQDMESIIGYKIPDDFRFKLSMKNKEFDNPTFVGIHFIGRLLHHPIRKLSSSSRIGLTPDGLPFYNSTQRLSRDEVALLSISKSHETLKELRLMKNDVCDEVRMGLTMLKTYIYMTEKDD